MKKSYLYNFWCIITMLFVSCNVYETPSESFSFATVVSSVNSSNVVNVRDILTFQDISQGIVSRKWNITNAEFVKGDSITAKVKIRFMKPGVQQVHLLASFIKSDYNLDTTFTITVLDTITANFNAMSNGIIYTSKQRITAEAGSGPITFTADCGGFPVYYRWFLKGSAEEGFFGRDLTKVEANYYLPGKYDAMLVASREQPWGLDTILIKEYLTILPSTKPASVQRILQTSDDKLEVAFNLGMKAPAVADITAFKVMRNNIPVSIKSLTLKSGDFTRFIMEIDGGVWNGDDVMVSYANGSVQSVVNTALSAFSDIAFTPYNANLILNPGFESGSWSKAFYNNNWGILENAGISTTQVHSGSQSVYMEAPSSVGGMMLEGDDYKGITGFRTNKSYKMEFWVYNKTLASYAEFGLNIIDGSNWETIIKSWTGGTAAGVTKDQWVKLSFNFKPNNPVDPNMVVKADSDKGRLWFYISSNFKGYIDDFMLYEIKRH